MAETLSAAIELQYADWTVESLGNVDYQFAVLRKVRFDVSQW
jgi:hypothetical protein